MFRDEFNTQPKIFVIESNKTPEENEVIIKKIQKEMIIETEIDVIKKKLRTAGLKIKNISPTNFGTEIIFFSKSDAVEASDVIGTSKIKNNSVFVG